MNKTEIWNEAYKNTGGRKIIGRNMDFYLPYCKSCDEIAGITVQWESLRQRIGNCNQTVGQCKNCNEPMVLDEYKYQRIENYVDIQRSRNRV